MAQTEALAPNWVNKRPVNHSKFIGIGMAEKIAGVNYQNEAKKNALFDLSSEIKVDISSNSILYTVQNNNQFNENFNSLIKLSNTENIEGYRLVDAYENDKQYWLYYELDKQEYENLKLKTKQLCINKAVNLINLSFNDEKDGNFTGSLKKRIQAFGVLSPYLNENIVLSAGNQINTILDLSNTIQHQLQSITIQHPKSAASLNPYQPAYKPLSYQLTVQNKNPLTDFPFVIRSGNERVQIVESASSNEKGDITIQIKTIKPLNQEIDFILNPDIEKLMSNDSIGKSTIMLLKQFITTKQLKAYANVSPVRLFISCTEKNMTKTIEQSITQPLMEQKFKGEEVHLVELKDQADVIIELEANTQKDISSGLLFAHYNVQLALLKVKLSLRYANTKELIYKTDITGVYGYANTLEAAGLNAYYSEQLKNKLHESLFFLKRKLIVY